MGSDKSDDDQTVSGTSITTSGKFGDGYNFTGNAGGHISVSGAVIPTSGSWTFDCWVKADSPGGYGAIWCQNDGAGAANRAILQLPTSGNGTLNFQIGSSNFNSDTQITVDGSTWHF